MIPVLDFAAQPDGAPPQVLTDPGEGWTYRPSGGPPMLVLRRSPDVLRALTDSAHFGMAGVTGGGDLAGCPLTGAEMQSPDGGLLNMNTPALREYRRRIGHLFTRRAAEGTVAAVRELAAGLTASLARQGSADVLGGYAAPFAASAISRALGVPQEDWEGPLAGYAATAFAVVPSHAAVPAVAAAWEDLYGYYGRARDQAPPGSLAADLGSALDGFTAAQVTHVTATVSNGFGAILPVLAVSLAELARRPHIPAACARGERTWTSVADELLRRRAMFPVALPRVALAATRIAGRDIEAGTVVLPSLIAAAHDVATPPPCDIAFGAGPHLCPGAALTRAWLPVALAAFWEAFPRALLAGGLEWQPGTLSIPGEIVLTLR